MKKIVVALILIFSSLLCFSQSYEIETSQGVRTITVPEGYTIEETLIEIFQLYLEERWDLEALLTDHAELITEVEEYKVLVNEYEIKVNDLLTDYDDLVKLYDKREALANFLFMPTIGFSYGEEQLSGRFGLGILWFQRVFTTLNIETPYRIGFTLGIKIF